MMKVPEIFDVVRSVRKATKSLAIISQPTDRVRRLNTPLNGALL